MHLTKDILENVIFSCIGINDGHRGGILVDDFKGHSGQVVKDFTTSFLSGNADMQDKKRHKLCEFRIMSGGITPKGQPNDAFIAKLVKGYYKESYDFYSLTAPVNKGRHRISQTTKSTALCPMGC